MKNADNPDERQKQRQWYGKGQAYVAWYIQGELVVG